MTRNLLSVAAAFFLFSQAAADSIAERLAACKAMTDEAARLSCYDRAADDPEPAVAVAEPSAAEPTPEPDPAPRAEPAPAVTSAPAPASTPAPAAATAAAADPLALFGMNPDLARQQEYQTAELDQITAVAVEVTKRTRGEHVVTLDNGQVWTEKDAESYFRVKVGDTIVIKRVSMGAYRMVGRGNRASTVRRIR